MPFKFLKTRIPDVVCVEPVIIADDRGSFAELFKASDFQANGLPTAFVQVSHARSRKNVVRGLHYQLNPKAQARLISVVHGEILDVAVDIRRGSPTYGQWVSALLSVADKSMLFIPEGFAHGYCVLSEEAEVIYFCSGEYAPELERNIAWNDPTIAIAWPVKDPALSPKDAGAPFLPAAENNF